MGKFRDVNDSKCDVPLLESLNNETHCWQIAVQFQFYFSNLAALLNFCSAINVGPANPQQTECLSRTIRK